MEEKEPQLSPKKDGALEKLNKLILGICGFVIVLLINDNRKTIEKMQESMAQISSSYSKLDTRVTLLEFINNVEKKTIKIPNNKDTLPPAITQRILSKPEDEYKFNPILY